MKNNPYEVLGVSPNATDDEIKHAYRELAKKYHPDNYADNPLSDLAEEKMKEINAAYDAICDERKNGGASDSFRKNSSSSTFPDVRKLIMEGRLDDATELLNGVVSEKRNAEWYFLMGMIYSRRGWSDQAYNYFQRAHQMDPGNAEYSAMLNNMNSRRSYNNAGYGTDGYGTPNCTCCDICAAVYCTECLCNCMRGC